MNNQNKMNWITWRLIPQNKATKLRLEYLYQPGKIPGYGAQTKCWSTPTQSQFLLRQIHSNERSFIGEMNVHTNFSQAYILPSQADSSHNFHEFVLFRLCPDWPKGAFIASFPTENTGAYTGKWFGDRGWGGFLARVNLLFCLSTVQDILSTAAVCTSFFFQFAS